MHLGFVIKKTLTLLALVDPFMAIPLFVCATAGLDVRFRDKYSRQLGIIVALSLLIGGLFGLHLLDFMGVSLASIQIGGGAIMFIVSLAMVVAKEETIKYTPRESEEAAAGPSIVPLGIPLLAGPAALSYVMATSQITRPEDLLSVILPPVAVGIVTWLCFRFVGRGGRILTPSALKVIERLAGFLLTAISVEMMVSGFRHVFPGLST